MSGLHGNWSRGHPWIMSKLSCAMLVRLIGLGPSPGGRSIPRWEALQVNLARWTRSTQEGRHRVIPRENAGPWESQTPLCPTAPPAGFALGEWADSKLPTVPVLQERSIFSHFHLQNLGEMGGRVPETTPWTPGRGICFQTRPLRSDAHPPLRLRAGDAHRHGVGRVQQGKRPGRVQADVQRQPRVSHLGVTSIQEGRATFELENLPLATGPFGTRVLLWNRSAAALHTGVQEGCGQRLLGAATLGEFSSSCDRQAGRT